MKITIGPYIDRWTTTSFERWYLKKRFKDDYWNIDEDRYSKFDTWLIDWFLDEVWQTVLNYTVNQYLDRKERNVKIQIDPYDTWSMDHTLAMIALPMLKQLQETKHGSPGVADEDVPEELKSTSAPPKENEWDTDANWHLRWDWVLNEMIFAFEMKNKDDWEAEFHSGNFDMLWVPIDKEGNELGPPKELGDKDYVKPEGLHAWKMVTGPNDTHVWDQEGQRKVQERISNGFRLFGKYYEGLWD